MVIVRLVSSEQEPLDLVEALARTALLVQRALERSAARHGTSPAQVRLLRALHDRAPTLNALARLLALDKSSTSGLVDRAQRRGLVRRVPSQLDRRSVRVRLTERGERLAAEVSAQLALELEALLSPLTPADRAALGALLSGLARA
ncbi:MAG: MarR family transcriptional regulator [Acidobacteriota bacterium]|nr:MarR family transcriptional regulator [Acidobacteriota bacterium]